MELNLFSFWLVFFIDGHYLICHVWLWVMNSWHPWKHFIMYLFVLFCFFFRWLLYFSTIACKVWIVCICTALFLKYLKTPCAVKFVVQYVYAIWVESSKNTKLEFWIYIYMNKIISISFLRKPKEVHRATCLCMSKGIRQLRTFASGNFLTSDQLLYELFNFWYP